LRERPVCNFFQVDAPLEGAGLDFRLDLLQAPNDAVALGTGQHAHLRQHGGVGDRPHDVVAVQALVEVDAGGETGDEGVDRLGEATAPGLVGVLLFAHRELVGKEGAGQAAGGVRRGAKYSSRTAFLFPPRPLPRTPPPPDTAAQ
jgi:hypothetical protein